MFSTCTRRRSERVRARDVAPTSTWTTPSTGHRSRTTRPARVRAPRSSRTAGREIGRHGLTGPTTRSMPTTSTCCSTASSQRRPRLAVDVELGHRLGTHRSIAASTVRACTCRQRTRTSTRGSRPISAMHSVCMRPLLGRRPPRCRRVGASTPNCQRTWFLAADAAVRVQDVALVEHGVGHPPRPLERLRWSTVTGRLPSAAARTRPPRWGAPGRPCNG